MKMSSASILALLLVADTDAGRVTSAHRRHQGFLGVNRTQVNTMSAMYPFYHTTSEISSELKTLAAKCPNMKLEHITKTGGDGNEVTIDVVSVKKADSTPVNKNFILFGEHARELISPESGLHFVRSLCGDNDLSEEAARVLVDNEYQLVINGNPHSRQKVEEGDFCMRVNENGVDLNRNWDEEWSPEAASSNAETNPGPKAFSELETNIFKDLLEKYRPNTFLSVHSGTRGMYMPWAYDTDHLAKRNQPQMMEILKSLDKDHCECPFGAAGKEVGYSCPGSSLDYVYDQLKAEYAFAFEIYDGNDRGDLKARWEEKLKEGPGSFLQRESHLAHDHFKSIFEKHPSSFVQLRSHTDLQLGMTPEACMELFNPTSEENYADVIDNWSRAYLQMSTEVSSLLKGSTQTKQTDISAALA